MTRLGLGSPPMLGSVCYFGTYESDYDRNRILQEALRLQGIRVLTCHEPVLEARRHKTGTLGSPAGVLGLGLQMARAWARLSASGASAECPSRPMQRGMSAA